MPNFLLEIAIIIAIIVVIVIVIVIVEKTGGKNKNICCFAVIPKTI